LEKNFRQSLDQIVVEALKPVTLTMAIMYAVFAVAHFMLLPAQKEMMTGIAAASSFIFLSIRIALHFRPLPSQFAHPVAAVVFLVALTNIFAHCLITSDARQPVNLLLLIVGAGMVFTSRTWLLSMIATGALTWFILLHHFNLPLETEIKFAFQLATAAVLAFVSYVVRVRAYVKLEQAKAELSDLSLTDALTGLRNRRAFNEFAEAQLRMATRANQPLALLYMDLDGLKPINDKLGHDVGDRALREFGLILGCHLRETDLIARLGGDEFCVLMSGDEEDVQHALERLRMHVSNRNQYDMEQQFKLQFSVGIVYFDHTKHAKIEDMMKIADERMYEEKRKSKDARV
jgi:diguanylate cyclase (GGDEF)-like protein